MQKNKNTSEENKTQASVNPVPEGFHTVTPYLIAYHADELIEFIKKAFNGKVTYMMKSDDGEVRHATIKVGDSIIMASNGSDQFKPMPCMLHLYVNDADSLYNQAIKAGGISLHEPTDEFYGDRSGCIKDAWGNQWWIATHVEDVSDEELKKREMALRKQVVHN